MILGVVSDLHLNFSSLDLPTEGLDALVIAGDTSPYHEQTASWIAQKLPRGLPVIMVMGNHDYEGFHIHKAAGHLKSCLAEYGLSDVHLLDNEAVVIDGVRFLGTPLWTRFDAFEPDILRHVAEGLAKYQICDFSTILSREGKLLVPQQMAAEHMDARNFLHRELVLNPYAGKTVVVSHFLPSTACCDTQFKGSPLNPYFATNVESLVELADLWIHGHTHASVDTAVKGTRTVCNPRGYSPTMGLSENPEWRPDFRIDLSGI